MTKVIKNHFCFLEFGNLPDPKSMVKKEMMFMIVAKMFSFTPKARTAEKLVPTIAEVSIFSNMTFLTKKRSSQRVSGQKNGCNREDEESHTL